MEITQEIAARILAGKGEPIPGPGVYEARVTSCNAYRSVKAGGVTQVAIANFALTTEFYDSKAKMLYKQGEYKKAAGQGLSLSVLKGQYCPVQGELMKVTVELVHLEATAEHPAVDALLARRMITVPAQKMKTISMEAWLEAVANIGKSEPEVSMVEEDEVLAPQEHKYTS